MLHTFIKDKEGWYIDLKNSPFTRRQLGMVRGADTLLDILSEGASQVIFDATTRPILGYEQLRRIKIHRYGFKGADYIMESFSGERIRHTLWLCPVTLWVFLRYPKTIYFKKVR